MLDKQKRSLTPLRLRKRTAIDMICESYLVLQGRGHDRQDERWILVGRQSDENVAMEDDAGDRESGALSSPTVAKPKSKAHSADRQTLQNRQHLTLQRHESASFGRARSRRLVKSCPAQQHRPSLPCAHLFPGRAGRPPATAPPSPAQAVVVADQGRCRRRAAREPYRQPNLSSGDAANRSNPNE